MPTRPDPAQPDEEPALEPIRVLRPRRTDALAELFKELEQDRGGYETVPLPASLPGAEDVTQQLPPVAEGAGSSPAPRGGHAGSGPAASRPRPSRTTVAVVVTAAAVIGLGGAFLLPDLGDGASAEAPPPSTTVSPSGAGAPTASGGPGAPGAGAPGGPLACTASYRTVSSWQGGYQGEVTVTNAPAAAASGWTATVVPADGARLTQVWDGTLSATREGTATVANASWNGALEPGASVTFGFLADASASAGAPSAKVTCAATADDS
ncbi:cellulose binding domain-containing protein [Streptomyces sp. NPDC006385]|uniref:cellulose binding domain-containing protein n=1 Tax=Streptomyces sp. NPDC006385 TaxID=3156761 RepID=UPI0033AA1241